MFECQMVPHWDSIMSVLFYFLNVFRIQCWNSLLFVSDTTIRMGRHASSVKNSTLHSDMWGHWFWVFQSFSFHLLLVLYSSAWFSNRTGIEFQASVMQMKTCGFSPMSELLNELFWYIVTLLGHFIRFNARIVSEIQNTV